MTEEDNDLQRMFAAQRAVDEGLAPSFSDSAAMAAAGDAARATRARKLASIPIRIVLSTIALSLVLCLAVWINQQQKRADERNHSLASHTDLQRVNQACDSLLVRINELDVDMMTRRNAVEQEMEWRTATDTLIPFESLSFNVRTSP